MNDRSTSQTQDATQQKQGGCCGGKTDAQPSANTEPQVGKPAQAKPAKSSCCCGQK